MKILYVENHEIFAKQVANLLLSGHDVTIVASLVKAREALAAEEYELLLVDYDLDDGKGSELVREVRALTSKLPMIGASSHDQGNQALLKAGVNAICSKMDFSHIEEVIRRVVSTV
jgi:DNA-binding NarL/FixJ family response regulator